ncbi:MAG: hypothetical protein PHT54_01740 [Candidatus Nanoarchaeia archaeon]|nr:hypothetical protein [Candidatus Nanoarchaeia archaeon]
MSNKNVRELKEERVRLIRTIQSCKNYKEKIARHVHKVKRDYDNNLISPSQYSTLLSKTLQGKHPRAWISYYDGLIRDYNKKLKHCEDRINEERLATRNNGLIVTITIITMIVGAGLFFESDITGFFTAEETNISDIPAVIVNETQEVIEEISTGVVDETIVNITEEPIQEVPVEEINETKAIIEERPVEIIYSKEFIDGIVEINKPVKWIKKINLNETTENLTINLPIDAENIKVNKILEESKELVEDSKLKIEEGLINVFSKERVQEKELVIDDSVKDIEIEYYVQGPRSVEKEINKYNKEIGIDSKIYYDTVKMSSDVPEVTHESKNIIIQESKENVILDDTNYIDSDSDGLIDKIEWVASSNETFETEIVSLTVKGSYLKDNKWIINIKTVGTADLRIAPAENVEINCINKINYEIIKNKIIVKDYYCDGETEVIAPAGNNLLFEFGDKYEEAYRPLLEPGVLGGGSPPLGLNIETVQEDEYIYTDVESINDNKLKVTV